MKRIYLGIIAICVSGSCLGQLHTGTPVPISGNNVGINDANPGHALDIDGDINLHSGHIISTNDIKVFQALDNGSIHVGHQSGSSNPSHDNTFIGENSGVNSVGNSNTAIGVNAFGNGTGSNTIAIGATALQNATGGERNVAIGTYTMQNAGSGSGNIGIGLNALKQNLANRNIAIGEDAMLVNTTGSHNVAVGRSVMRSNTVGNTNVAIGENALWSNTAGNENIALGYQSMYSNSTGLYNVSIGSRTLNQNVTGKYNVAIGYDALADGNPGTNNAVSIGPASGVLSEDGVAIGHHSDIENGSDRSVAMGRDSYAHGVDAVAIGYSADAGKTSQSWSADCGISIGGASEVYADMTTAIGCKATVMPGAVNSTAIGNGAFVNWNQSNTVVIGNTAIQSIGGYTNWTNLSDGRFKKNVSEEGVFGLDFIQSLRPVTYNLDLEKLLDHCDIDHHDKQGIESKEAELQIGFIAQEVSKAADEIGFDFHGVDEPESRKGHFGLRYAEFVVPLVKAVQEQQEMIEADEEKIADLEEENETLKDRLDAMENLLKRIDSDLQQCCFNYDETGSLSGVEGSDDATGSVSPTLEQNQPNPFDDNTAIKYFLPTGSQNATLTISNLDGKVVKSFNLNNNGHGQVLLSGGSLASGHYFYTLSIAGEQIDTKQMILN